MYEGEGCSLKISNAFITGATGFIGGRLAEKLVNNGIQVTCLVRKQSKIEPLKKLGCRLVYGDLTDESLQLSGVEKCDALFHVAAMKNAAIPKVIVKTNRSSTKNLFEAILRSSGAPRVVQVSSLAACGPSAADQPKVETDAPVPVSFYGKSKLESEKTAITYADRIPISIVRPPIVVGQGDSAGLGILEPIYKYNFHLVPGFKIRQYSMIHVDDLVSALVCIATQGQPIATTEADLAKATGIYFAAAQQLSCADLGRKIGEVLERSRIRCLHVPRPIVWGIAAFNTLLGRAINQARFFNLDKYREVIAGNWTCSTDKIFAETNFDLPVPFEDRLKQTIHWYQENGWLDYHIQPPAHA